MKKEILDQIGAGELTVGWIVDEFDSSFDTLAMASIRYHLYHSHASNAGPYGDKLKALLDDFETLHGTRILYGDLVAHMDQAVPSGDYEEELNHSCEECTELVKQAEAAEKKYNERQAELRHRFIEILPGLWS